MSGLLQKLPRELLTEIASYLDIEDIFSFHECVYFDISPQTYHRFFPYDGDIDKCDVSILKERMYARPYFLADELQPVQLQEPIVKVSMAGHWVYFLTQSGDIWFTGKDIEEEYAMVQKSRDKDWGILNGLVRFRSENVHVAEPKRNGQYGEEWTKRHPSYLKKARRKYVDVTVDKEGMAKMNLVDDQGVVISIEDDEYRGFKDGWFDCDYGYCAGTPKFGRPTPPESGFWIMEKAIKVQSQSTMYKGKGIAVPYELTFDSEFFFQNNLIVPNTAVGVKDWARFYDCVICLRKDGSVDLVNIPEEERLPDNYETRPENFDSLKALNKMGPFAQISSYYNKLMLVTTSGRVVMSTVEQSIVEAHYCRNLTDVVSVVVGGTHFLALTKSGQVYSWGRERRPGGYLGFGANLPAGTKIERIDENVHFVTVDEPHKVNLPGKAYYIAAGSRSSVVLCGNK